MWPRTALVLATGIDAAEWAREVVERGAGEIMLTSMNTDGHQDGYDTPLTRAVSDAVGMPVIASGGLVGQIRDIVNGKPQVLLVTDARSAVDVILETSRTRGIAVGSGDQRTYRTELKYVDRSESAIDGERVLTTGDDERFNEGLYVGTVRLDPKAPRRQITVLPAVRFEELDLVYIVLGTTGLTPDGRRYKGRKR